jgi:hypothetical protein
MIPPRQRSRGRVGGVVGRVSLNPKHAGWPWRCGLWTDRDCFFAGRHNDYSDTVVVLLASPVLFYWTVSPFWHTPFTAVQQLCLSLGMLIGLHVRARGKTASVCGPWDSGIVGCPRGRPRVHAAVDITTACRAWACAFLGRWCT